MATTRQKLKAPAISSQTAKVQPLTGAIGAELNNVHLANASRDPALMEDIRSLLLHHKVLFFQNQDISRAEHAGAGNRTRSRFGTIARPNTTP